MINVQRLLWKTGRKRGIFRAKGEGRMAQSEGLRAQSEAELVPLPGGVRGG